MAKSALRSKTKRTIKKPPVLSKPVLLIFALIFAAIGGYAIYRSFAASGTTYYIADTGSDSNSGTSESSPWLHAPGMTGCSAVCASTTPQPGDQFILRGGDSWAYTGSGQTPVGLPWTWSPPPEYGWNGSAGNQIYVGVNQSWYNSSVCGSNWCRPILNGSNPLSTSVVSSCAIPNGFALDNKGSYVTFDNFEIKGFCMDGDDPSGDDLLTMDYNTNNSKFTNLYIHGWTIDDAPYGQRLTIFQGATNGPVWPQTNNEWAYNVIDGSDSSPQSGGVLYGDCYNFDHNYVTHVVNFVCNNGHDFNNNVFEFFNENASADIDHGNVLEYNAESDENNYFYNNVIRHIGDTSSIGVNVWFDTPNTDYFFNNVMYDVNSSANFIDQSGGGILDFYNNTIQISQSNQLVDDLTNSTNNDWITNYSPFWQGTTPTVTDDLIQSLTQASDNGSGYTEGNQYAPTSAYHPTASAGANLSSLCSQNADFANLCYDTTLGVSYDTANHTAVYPARSPTARPSSGAWDIGAYQYGSSGGGTPAPTVSLSASPTSISSGSSSSLSWSSSNATSCSATSPTNWTSSTASSGNQSVSPTTTTTYNLSCTGAGGTTNASATVTVTGSGGGGGGNTINIGETSVLTTPDSGNANLLLAQSATLSQAATIQSLSFYVTTAAGNLRLGIYDNSGPNAGPGKLLASTPEIVTSSGWDTASVVTPVLLQPGTYWLAYTPSSNSLSFESGTSSGSSLVYQSFSYGALPATFSTAPTAGPAHWSFYATLSTGSSGSSVPGDCNGDGHVNINDLSLLLSNYGTNYAACDFNHDGIINILDFSILLSHYGT